MPALSRLSRKCVTNSLYELSVTRLRATNATSYPEKGPPTDRHASRIRRFALLRQTAFPNFLPAIKATRPLWSCCPSVRNTIKRSSGVFTRLPFSKRRVISALDLIVFTIGKPLLDGQALAPLGTTTRENGTAALGRHAGTETVALCALASVRLICALHMKPFQTSF